MKLPEFSKMSQDKEYIPQWADKLKDGEFISYSTTYKTKQYFDLFDKYELDGMTYYVYDPVKHGAAADKKYPVLMWLHGLSNSLDGINCVMCCGAEQYASEKYQQKMKGAFLIVPLANEKRLDDGSIVGGWGDDENGGEKYPETVMNIFRRVCSEHSENAGKRFVMGASSGGYFTWKLLEDNTGFFDGAIPIASAYVPEDAVLDRISETGTFLLIAHGRHDEMADFDKYISPREEKLRSLKNCICFFPEWVCNGDGGAASIYYGLEMGQHCMINEVQADLMFDSGKPACEELPEGVTGWIRTVCER